MLNGDISNRAAPTIAFRVEDNLIQYKENTFKDKVLNFILGKEKRAEINPKVLKAIYYIFKHTDMSVDLVAYKDNVNDEFLTLLKDVPYNRLKIFEKEVSILIDLNVKEYDYFVDNNAERRSRIGHKNVIDLNDLYLLIRR